MKAYTISRLAFAADVHVETVRYYQRRGLLTEPEKAIGSIRRYGDEDVDRLRFIKRAQGIGFSLDEVASLLNLRTNVSCDATRGLAASKIAIIDDRIESLRRIRAELAACVSACSSNTDDTACPVIAMLNLHT